MIGICHQCRHHSLNLCHQYKPTSGHACRQNQNDLLVKTLSPISIILLKTSICEQTRGLGRASWSYFSIQISTYSIFRVMTWILLLITSMIFIIIIIINQIGLCVAEVQCNLCNLSNFPVITFLDHFFFSCRAFLAFLPHSDVSSFSTPSFYISNCPDEVYLQYCIGQ